jgi:hypothetical protein
MFQVSDVVRNKAVMAGAPEWIEQLPDLVSVLLISAWTQLSR